MPASSQQGPTSPPEMRRACSYRVRHSHFCTVTTGSTKKRLALFGQAVLERVELVLEAGRQLLTDELEPLLDQRELGTPLLGLDGERLVDVGGVHIEAFEVEVG